jgi:hypothetical protein
MITKEAHQMSALIEIVTDQDAIVEMVDLFSIDGTTYQMPKEISGSVPLELLHRIRTEGEPSALSWMLQEVLGDTAYMALMGCKAMKPNQLGAIMTVVQERVMGAMEEIRGE